MMVVGVGMELGWLRTEDSRMSRWIYQGPIIDGMVIGVSWDKVH
jgi:hypothetical protein